MNEDFPVNIPASQETVNRCSIIAYSQQSIGIEQTILLINDNEGIRKELASILEQYGDMPLRHFLQRSFIIMKGAGYFPN